MVSSIVSKLEILGKGSVTPYNISIRVVLYFINHRRKEKLISVGFELAIFTVILSFKG